MGAQHRAWAGSLRRRRLRTSYWSTASTAAGSRRRRRTARRAGSPPELSSRSPVRWRRAGSSLPFVREEGGSTISPPPSYLPPATPATSHGFVWCRDCRASSRRGLCLSLHDTIVTALPRRLSSFASRKERKSLVRATGRAHCSLEQLWYLVALQVLGASLRMPLCHRGWLRT